MSNGISPVWEDIRVLGAAAINTTGQGEESSCSQCLRAGVQVASSAYPGVCWACSFHYHRYAQGPPWKTPSPATLPLARHTRPIAATQPKDLA